MPDYSLEVNTSIGAYPEGEEMTPSQFAQWLADNLQITISGSFLAGQIDGATPTTDVGIWVRTADRKIMIWNGTAYQNLLNVPVGSLFPWPSAGVTPPEDYVLAANQLLLKTDYPLLWAVLGDTWKAVGDDALYFRLPDTRGRVPMGTGTGSYNPKAVVNPNQVANMPIGTVLNGNLMPRASGQYFGYEFPAIGIVKQTDTPLAGGDFLGVTCRHAAGTAHADWQSNYSHYEGCVQPSFVTQWIIKAK